MSEHRRPLGWPAWLREAERRCPDALRLAEHIAATRPCVDDLDAAQLADLDRLTAAGLTTIRPDGVILRSRRDGTASDRTEHDAA